MLNHRPFAETLRSLKRVEVIRLREWHSPSNDDVPVLDDIAEFSEIVFGDRRLVGNAPKILDGSNVIRMRSTSRQIHDVRRDAERKWSKPR